MKQIILIIILSQSWLLTIGQEKKDSLGTALAKRVLEETNKVVSGGDKGTPSEVLAFNIIYRLPNAAQEYKDTYKNANIAGKFYCLIGLYLFNDIDYEKYKINFLTQDDKTIYFRAGSKVSENYDKEELLKNWINGISTNLWYTDILIKK